MDFISNKEVQNNEMLKTIGIKTIEELFELIPKEIKLKAPELDDGLSEFEGMKLMESLAAKNTFGNYDNYLGAGSYEHHIPCLIAAICGKSEFLTSYTPYQPEASQGMLQIIFEYQSAICALTGMDVSNASLYDGSSACAEALLMALRANKGKNKLLVAESVHPNYRGVIGQYLSLPEVELKTIGFLQDGSLNTQQFEKELDNNVAGVLLQYPNFFGNIEDIKQLSQKIKAAGSLLIICANPLVYGLYADASELGADIAVGDCQPFGLPMQFGGPYAGYIACKQELVRQLPGRIVGQTVDTQQRKGYVLTLQAREQHIRREKATSNICTNQALAALATLIGMLWYGKQGIPKLALANYQRAAYLKEKLANYTEPLSQLPIFNEFAFKCRQPIKKVQTHFRKHGVEPGLDLGQFYPGLQNCLLIAVTETKTKEQLDKYVDLMKSIKN